MNSLRAHWRILFVLLGAFGLASCGVNPPKAPRADPYSPRQIHVDSESLRNDTAIGRPIVVRDESGLLIITVPIRSAINKTLYVDYWVSFFDERGQRLSKLGPFTKTLQANTPDSIEVKSLSPKANDFQIDLRYAR